jgi:hypothetical protein
MEPELALKAITHMTIAIALLTLLVLLLISLRKELSGGGQAVRGLVHAGILVIGLCTFLLMMVAMYSAKRIIVPERTSQPLDTAASLRWRSSV